jgi:hypothetical protein
MERKKEGKKKKIADQGEDFEAHAKHQRGSILRRFFFPVSKKEQQEKPARNQKNNIRTRQRRGTQGNEPTVDESNTTFGTFARLATNKT